MNGLVYIAAVDRNGERFVVLHDGSHEHRMLAIETLSRWARNQDLSFTFTDAWAVLRAMHRQTPLT